MLVAITGPIGLTGAALRRSLEHAGHEVRKRLSEPGYVFQHTGLHRALTAALRPDDVLRPLAPAAR